MAAAIDCIATAIGGHGEQPAGILLGTAMGHLRLVRIRGTPSIQAGKNALGADMLGRVSRLQPLYSLLPRPGDVALG